LSFHKKGKAGVVVAKSPAGLGEAMVEAIARKAK